MPNGAGPGRVEWIHVAVSEGEPMRATDRIRVLAGIGLEGVVAKSLLDPLSHHGGCGRTCSRTGKFASATNCGPWRVSKLQPNPVSAC